MCTLNKYTEVCSNATHPTCFHKGVLFQRCLTSQRSQLASNSTAAVNTNQTPLALRMRTALFPDRILAHYLVRGIYCVLYYFTILKYDVKSFTLCSLR